MAVAARELLVVTFGSILRVGTASVRATSALTRLSAIACRNAFVLTVTPTLEGLMLTPLKEADTFASRIGLSSSRPTPSTILPTALDENETSSSVVRPRFRSGQVLPRAREEVSLRALGNRRSHEPVDVGAHLHERRIDRGEAPVAIGERQRLF